MTLLKFKTNNISKNNNAMSQKKVVEFVSPLQPNAFSEPVLHKVVMSRIDFELPDFIWRAINNEFEFYWNYIAGLGNYASCDDACRYIYQGLKEKMAMITFDKVVTIVNIIWDFIEQIPGVLLKDEIEPDNNSISDCCNITDPLDEIDELPED